MALDAEGELMQWKAGIDVKRADREGSSRSQRHYVRATRINHFAVAHALGGNVKPDSRTLLSGRNQPLRAAAHVFAVAEIPPPMITQVEGNIFQGCSVL